MFWTICEDCFFGSVCRDPILDLASEESHSSFELTKNGQALRISAISFHSILKYHEPGIIGHPDTEMLEETLLFSTHPGRTPWHTPSSNECEAKFAISSHMVNCEN